MMPTSKQDNVVLLKEGTDAYNRGDFAFLFSRAADDIEVYADHRLLNAGRHKGREQFEKWLHEWNEAWSEITIDVQEISEVDDRFLVVEVHQRAVGRESGVPVEMDVVQLLEFRDGKLARFHLYPDRTLADEALAELR